MPSISWWTACRLWGAMDETDDADLLCVASATSFVEYLGSLEEHSEVLKRLLMEKNAEGFTPFMAAVSCKVNEHCINHKGSALTMPVPEGVVRVPYLAR